MASTITNLIKTIDVAFPVAGQDNDSQGFRNNYNIIQSSLLALDGVCTALGNSISTMGGTEYLTATHIVAYQDVMIGDNLTTRSTFSLNENDGLVVTSANDIILKPRTGVVVRTTGAYALTDSVTNSSTGTFAVDDVRNIEVGATITFPDIAGTFTVVTINSESNLITVTPEFADTPPPFQVGDTLTFANPFTATTTTTRLIVYGDIYATGNITAFSGNVSDAKHKENVRTIPNALSLVNDLRGVYYDWSNDYLASLPFSLPKNDIGVIAQEVKQVLPEVVFEDADTGNFSVKYEKIVGVLIEAVKELSREVADLKTKVNNV